MKKRNYKKTIFFFLFILLQTLVVTCSDPTSSYASLKMESSYKLDLPEPSGLTLGENQESLWVVSDNPDNRIYNISLTGQILKTLSFSGSDLEGITYDALSNSLWVLDEGNAQLINVSITGSVIQRKNLAGLKRGAHGGEGLAMINDNLIWTANESSPAKIYVFDGQLNLQDSLFAEEMKDYSGLAKEENSNRIWIISDESKMVKSYNMETAEINTFEISFKKGEGIAVHSTNGKIYIVNDETSRLYVYENPEK